MRGGGYAVRRRRARPSARIRPIRPGAASIAVGSGALAWGMWRSINDWMHARQEHSGTAMPVWGQMFIRIP